MPLQARCEGVPEIMKVKIDDLGSSRDRRPIFSEGTKVFPSAKDTIVRVQCYLNGNMPKCRYATCQDFLGSGLSGISE
jgi:hypothetical protein